ncbi:MAG: ribonuclease III [Anaerolineae bacterium]|nr:ribonuclease III [Anaerolineae bacterium]
MFDITHIEQALNLTFADKALLQRALTHRSYLNENPDYPLEDNERLEFLGDAILDFITGEYLYHHFPEMAEGQLTNLRSALVRTETLAYFATQLDLGEFLFLGRGEEEGGGRKRKAILCDAFEALIGALYLERGLDFARQFVLPMIEPALEEVLTLDTQKDAKSRLQELAQSHYQVTPTYRTIKEEGPDHAKEFTVEALIGNKSYGQGLGYSKQTAAQAAAEQALEKLQQELTNEERLSLTTKPGKQNP